MLSRAERRAQHERDRYGQYMAEGHPHAIRSDACPLCAAEACAQRDAQVSTYKASLSAWQAGPKRRPYTKVEHVIGVIQFFGLLVAGPMLFVAFYGGMFAAWRTIRWVANVGPEAAIDGLLGTIVLIAIFALLMGDPDRDIKAPEFPKADPFTYNAVTERYMASRPRYVKPVDTRPFAEQWPDDLPAGSPMVPIPARPRRRPGPRVREVIDSWNLPDRQPDDPDDLPF